MYLRLPTQRALLQPELVDGAVRRQSAPDPRISLGFAAFACQASGAFGAQVESRPRDNRHRRGAAAKRRRNGARRHAAEERHCRSATAEPKRRRATQRLVRADRANARARARRQPAAHRRGDLLVLDLARARAEEHAPAVDAALASGHGACGERSVANGQRAACGARNRLGLGVAGGAAVRPACATRSAARGALAPRNATGGRRGSARLVRTARAAAGATAQAAAPERRR